jgi:hypothetical protein
MRHSRSRGRERDPPGACRTHCEPQLRKRKKTQQSSTVVYLSSGRQAGLLLPRFLGLPQQMAQAHQRRRPAFAIRSSRNSA